MAVVIIKVVNTLPNDSCSSNHAMGKDSTNESASSMGIQQYVPNCVSLCSFFLIATVQPEHWNISSTRFRIRSRRGMKISDSFTTMTVATFMVNKSGGQRGRTLCKYGRKRKQSQPTCMPNVYISLNSTRIFERPKQNLAPTIHLPLTHPH